MRRMIAATSAAVLASTLTVALPASASAGEARPSTYVVSREPGVLPEGIAVTDGGTMYVTSVGTGAVYRGHTRSAELAPFLPAGSDGRTAAAGIHVDGRGRLFVAGWDTGALFVHDADGSLVARRVAPLAGAALNDLAITDDAVYVTDSATGTLWRAAIDGPEIGELTPWLTPADFPGAPGFLNGIVATDGGRLALVADQGTELLYRVDLLRRTASVVEVTGGRMGADGLLLQGNRLYGVVNFPDGAGGTSFAVNLAVLSPDLTAAHVVCRSAPVPQDQFPTTIARDGDRLLWVNSQLGAATPTPPFTVTQVPDLR
ncbi:superoxide dismutase [Micromonospora phytophila]|uniref:SMP-30/gluconolactonase/LRE family protein n=1 Tax=Micromonospora phytophila TaxID=709888 RepID=UPI00202F1909|nr:superoxide dismutase [Micromonospora phytophila]MCM0675082.1 superoxide dismutase [Micromonospora phytophila]